MWSNNDIRGVAQSGSVLAWGASGRRFKSCRPDQKKQTLDIMTITLSNISDTIITTMQMILAALVNLTESFWLVSSIIRGQHYFIGFIAIVFLLFIGYAMRRENIKDIPKKSNKFITKFSELITSTSKCWNSNIFTFTSSLLFIFISLGCIGNMISTFIRYYQANLVLNLKQFAVSLHKHPLPPEMFSIAACILFLYLCIIFFSDKTDNRKKLKNPFILIAFLLTAALYYHHHVTIIYSLASFTPLALAISSFFIAIFTLFEIMNFIEHLTHSNIQETLPLRNKYFTNILTGLSSYIILKHFNYSQALPIAAATFFLFYLYFKNSPHNNDLTMYRYQALAGLMIAYPITLSVTDSLIANYTIYQAYINKLYLTESYLPFALKVCILIQTTNLILTIIRYVVSRYIVNTENPLNPKELTRFLFYSLRFSLASYSISINPFRSTTNFLAAENLAPSILSVFNIVSDATNPTKGKQPAKKIPS
jgi:hypothetical protein